MWIGTYRVGQKVRKQRAGTGTGKQESLGNHGRPEWLWIGTDGAVGTATQEDENINDQSTLVGYF